MAGSFPRSIRVLGIAVCWLGLTAPTLRADPIAVTSGHFDFGRGGNLASFSFLGADGFVLDATGVPTARAFPSSCGSTGCRPGDTFNPSLVAGNGSGVTSGVPLPAAFTLGTALSATVNGTTFAPRVLPPTFIFPGPLGLAGSLRFDAPPIVLSDTATFFGSPFLFSGHVTGFGIDDVDARHPLFDVDLVGRGTAFVDFEDEGAMHMVFGATSAPTPEPATLLLLGTALVSVAARSRRKGQNP
jgi:hypothetical protein